MTPEPSHPRDLRLESFEVWLERQIQAAKALYDSTAGHRHSQRRWDQFLLLKGVQAEYERRITR